MSTFATRNIDAVVGKQVFQKLVMDGVCLFDEFEEECEQEYKAEIRGLYAIMNDVANLKAVPKTKFHPYDNGDPREFEFKTKHLRVYAIEIPNGKLIVLGGTKAKQKKEGKEFRSIKNKYLEYKNNSNKKRP